jgi:TPR repeat protein
MYQHGKGVGQSNEKARALLKQAADRGHKQAIRQLEEWNRLNSVTLQHFWENM